MTPAERAVAIEAFKGLLNTLHELAETCALRDADPGWKTWLRTQEELEELQTDIARIEAERAGHKCTGFGMACTTCGKPMGPAR